LFVVFDPNVAGSATGQLKISSNSSSGATTVVSLTGSGQSIPYQVNLSWNAPASSPDPVTGYNVLRAPTGTTTYQQLNTSTIAATNYVDGSVQNGTTYDYVVQSVDAAGTSSVPSNTYTAAIPQ
jgi:fibronectin type 3 domain-containing protein